MCDEKSLDSNEKHLMPASSVLDCKTEQMDLSWFPDVPSKLRLPDLGKLFHNMKHGRKRTTEPQGTIIVVETLR